MTLYEEILEESQPFLGRQTEQFVRRQCQGHLHIAPRELTKEHLPRLSYWMMLSASLIMSEEQAKELEQKILALGE